MIETQPQNRRLGYARVSTYGQTLDAQLEQLKAEGCAKIYREKASGAKSDWRELLRLLSSLAPGDVVTVTRIDAGDLLMVTRLDRRRSRRPHADRAPREQAIAAEIAWSYNINASTICRPDMFETDGPACMIALGKMRRGSSWRVHCKSRGIRRWD